MCRRGFSSAYIFAISIQDHITFSLTDNKLTILTSFIAEKLRTKTLT